MHGRPYRVRAGETLSGIAEAQLGRAAFWPRIYVYNNQRAVMAVTHHGMKDPNKIRVGETIYLPPPEPVSHPRIRSALHTGVPHLHQTTRPTVPAPTAQAQAHTQATPAAPAGLPKPAPAPSPDAMVNSFPFKYNLDLIPEQKIEGPNFEATLKFQGTIVIWQDKQIPIVTFTNKGAEAAAKQETDTVLGKLVSQDKISFDPASKKVSFENLMTVQAKGMPPSVVAVGIAADSSNPVPALRAKFTSQKLEGRVGQHLFIAENVTVTIDIRLRPDDNDITRRPNPVPVQAPVPQRAWYEGPVGWVQRHGNQVAAGVLVVGAGVLVTAAVASNFVTFGTDTPIDVPAFAGAAGMLRTAAVLAH